MGSGNSGKGALLNVGANYGTSLTPDTRMIFSVATTVANSHYMQENFGVSASQATATRYKRYAPGSDCRDVTAGVSLVHQLSREWMLITSVNRTTLANDAKDSPLVRKASSNSTFASVAYTF
jgi:outer membrane protein